MDEVDAVLKELYDHSRGGECSKGSSQSSAWSASTVSVAADTAAAIKPATVDFPEDDAKRAAEQLKGIIHDTDGATCVCSAFPRFEICG